MADKEAIVGREFLSSDSIQPALEVMEGPLKGNAGVGQVKVDPPQELHIFRTVGSGGGAAVAGICCIVPEHFTDIFGVVVLVYLFISAGKELKAEAGKVSAQ